MLKARILALGLALSPRPTAWLRARGDAMARLAIALGVITALASPAAGQGRVAIDFWTNGTSAEQAFFETLIAEFERQNPTIDVRVQAIATPQYLNAVQLAYRSGNEPDVLRAQGNFFNVQLPLPKWVEQGWLLPLDRFVTSSVLARFPAGAVNDSLTRVNGRLYSLPMQRRGTSALLALVYNKRLYAAAGLTTPPRTWDEMRAHARRIAAAGGGRTFGLGIEPGNPRANFLAARGGFVGDHRSALDFRTGRYNASDPAMVAAVNLMRTMNLEDRSVVPGWEANYDIPASFARGQIGMFLAQPSQVANLLADFKMSPADFGLAVVPGPAGRPPGCPTSRPWASSASPPRRPTRPRRGASWTSSTATAPPSLCCGPTRGSSAASSPR